MIEFFEVFIRPWAYTHWNEINPYDLIIGPILVIILCYLIEQISNAKTDNKI